ncbi:MAG: hypothetical protein ACYDHF_03975 [Candidatus Cryosericum sp.]
MERDDRDIEKLLETTDWEPEPNPVREQTSLARLVGRLDRRRHRMRMVGQVSCACVIVMLVMVTGATWYRWTRPMAVAVQETQSLPLSAARLIQPASTETPDTWQTLLARATAQDPRGLLASVRTVPGTDLLRAELRSGTGYVLLLPGQGVIGIVAAASDSAKITEGFTAVTSSDAPGITTQDLAAARSAASNDSAVARVGSPDNDVLQVASVYQPTTPYKNDNHAVPYDPFVLSTPDGYVRMRRIVAVLLKPQQENQTLLTALVDIDAHRVVGIVDTTHIAGILLTDDPGPQLVLAGQ